MSLTTYVALLLYSFVSSVTPGPNNIMLFASGVNFGLRRSVPHMLGISFGFGILLAAVGAGLGAVLELWPLAFLLIKVLGGAYMLYLAWRIANAGPPDGATRAARPMRFIEAVAFQWVNPKAWTMALSAISAYAPDQSMRSIGVVALVFGAINLPAVSSWTLLGTGMSRFLTSRGRLRAFNWTMAGLLVASLIPVLLA